MRLEYLDRLPTAVPLNRVLVHNTVRPTRRLGSRGFRAWLSCPDSGTARGLRLPVGAGARPTLRVRRSWADER